MKIICKECSKYSVYKVMYFLSWFSKKTEFIAGDEKLNLSEAAIRKLLGYPAEESLTDCYPINAFHLEQLVNLIKHKINLKKYDYFIEGVQADNDSKSQHIFFPNECYKEGIEA